MPKKIIMYSTVWCGDCRAARAFLDQNKIDYTNIYIEDDDEAASLVMRVNNGRRSVPTFEIDGQYLNASPFTPENRKKLADAIGISN